MTTNHQTKNNQLNQINQLKQQQEQHIEQDRDDARRTSRRTSDIIDEIEDIVRASLRAFDADMNHYQAATHMFGSMRDELDMAVNQRMRELEHNEEDVNEQYHRSLSRTETGQ